MSLRQRKQLGSLSLLIVPILVTIASLAALRWGWLACEADGAQFARAGALVTTFALGFTFWRYSYVLESSQQTIAEEVAKDLAQKKIDPTLAALAQRVAVDDVGLIRRRIDTAITYWQGCTLAVGTLVWGFGDLVFQYKAMPWNEFFWRLFHLGSKAPFS